MSRRPFNPFAQPYHPHHVYHPNQIFIYQTPSFHYVPNLYYVQNQTLVTEDFVDQATVDDESPSYVFPMSLDESQSRTTTIWKKKNQASNLPTASYHGNTLTAESSSSSSRRGRRRTGSRRKMVDLRSNLGHGVQGSIFPNARGSVVPFPNGRNGIEVTTLMIRNIPCKLSRRELLLKLERHCLDENQKAGSFPKSEFDFVYLPLDFKQFRNRAISNLGYAFVNFTSAVGALRLYQSHHKSRWEEVVKSPKICEITCAKIQGLEALKKRFGNKRYAGNLTEEVMPVILVPARDGSREFELVL